MGRLIEVETYADIDVYDLFSEASDQELMDEVTERRLNPNCLLFSDETNICLDRLYTAIVNSDRHGVVEELNFVLTSRESNI